VDSAFELPYPSRRMPVFARNVVASSHPLASQAGLAMLHRGGTAADAAIAAAITLTVVEPTRNGIGSDAFALVQDKATVAALDGSGRSPRKWTRRRFLDRGQVPQRGWESVTVPGAVSAWVELHQRYGALPFASLFEPAIAYARDGFAVTPFVASSWREGAALFAHEPEFRRVFMPQGRAPRVGEVFRAPDMAATLELIASSRGEAFYRGALAARIAAAARTAGAAIDASDLDKHHASWRDPIALHFFGAWVHELPPSCQGIAVLIALGILKNWGLTRHGPDDPAAVHLQVEALKLAIADTYRYVADPEAMTIDVEDLLHPTYLEERAACISESQARDPGHGRPRPGGTVYLAAADADGMMVSFIQSNYMGFGSGIVVPGTGISLQNRAAGFVLDPNHPNVVDGAKRPFHTLMPGLVTHDDHGLMAFGVMGGPMQPQGQLQVLIRTLVYGQNPQAALDAPRFRIINGRRLALEAGFCDETRVELMRRGHDVELVRPGETSAFGGGQVIRRSKAGYVAGSDSRKDGLAAGF